MKTLIVALYPYKGQGLDSWIDHGAGMTYTAAKKAGCDVSFLDMKKLSSDEELSEAMKGYDLIAISMKSSYYAIGMKVVKYAKANGSKVMIGGYHATAAPHELLENPDIDYVFHGESEITFPEFLKSPESFGREITGKKPGDLDDLSFLDRSIYLTPIENCLNWWHGGKLSRMTTVMAARGCPYKCAFCQPLEDNHFGKRLRRRSVDSLINELLFLKETYHPECVMIHDDTFLIQPKWLEEFIEKYPQIGLPFWAAGRADGICNNPDLVKKLIDVGWELVSVGFESGSQRILDLMEKGTTVRQNLEAAEIVHSYGAKLYANYMTGLPWETKWDIQETYKMADKIKAEMPSWAFFTPYPGCKLGDELIKRGWSLLNKETYDRCPSGNKCKHVDYEYIARMRRGLRETVYPTFTDIIIPAYNNESYSVNCINSIKRNTKPGTYRIIFVDNASEPNSVKSVKHVLNDTDHLFIQMPTNEGFVGAINAGMEASNAPNVCLLNNDTLVTDRWLEKLVSTLSKDPKLGIVGAMTQYGKGKAVDSHHSLSMHTSLLPEESLDWNVERLSMELEKRYSGRTYPANFVAFLCAVIKREVIDKVGLLDTNYAMGMWDDLDYNRSTRIAGYKTELAIDTCIKHFGRSTFHIIQQKENFDVNALLRTNRGYLDKKWKGIVADEEKPMIISRAIYKEFGLTPGLGILTEDRLSLMQRYFINSLKNQTDSEFLIYLVVGPRDNEATKQIESLDWKGLDVNFLYSEDDLSTWTESVVNSRNFGREIDFGCPEYLARISNHPKTTIMARLDTDDWVAPGWIYHMKYLAKSCPETHFLINYQVIGQVSDGRLYNFSQVHTKARTSPFIALVQKSDPRISPYEDLHLRMGGKFSKVYTIPPAYAFMVIHGENRSNRFYKGDTFIGGDEVNPSFEAVHFKRLAEVSKKAQKIAGSIKGTDWRSRIARANAMS